MSRSSGVNFKKVQHYGRNSFFKKNISCKFQNVDAAADTQLAIGDMQSFYHRNLKLFMPCYRLCQKNYL